MENERTKKKWTFFVLTNWMSRPLTIVCRARVEGGNMRFAIDKLKSFLFSWLVYFLKHVLCPPCIWNKFVVFIAMWPTVQESIETVCSSVKTSGVELKCSAKGKIVMIVALKTDFGQDGWLYYQRSSRSAILRKRKGRFQVELCQNVTRWSSFNGMASASDPALFTQFFPPLGFLSRRPKREIQSPFFYLANLQVDG